MRIFKDFTFEASHFLPNVPKGHKCGRLHGHSYRFRVWCADAVGDKTGWVIDYGDIAAQVEGLVLHTLDHQTLNNVGGLENPTTEIVAAWIFRRLALRLPLHSVEVYESATTGCVCTAEDAGGEPRNSLQGGGA